MLHIMIDRLVEVLALSRLFEAAPERYPIAVGGFITLAIIFIVGKYLAAGISKRFTVKPDTFRAAILAYFIQGISSYAFPAVALTCALLFLRPVGWLKDTLVTVLSLLVIYHLAKIAEAAVRGVGTRTLRNRYGAVAQDGRERSSLRLIGAFSRGVVWVLGIVFILSNLGVNVTSLVAGLGVGGVVVGFALKAVFDDLFGSLSIRLDKPFQEGDFIVVGNQMGTVQKIGIKTTRLQSLGGEQVIISNTDLISSRIHNYKRMPERRVEFRFRVPLDLPLDTLKKVGPMVREVIERKEGVRFDRAHLKEFSEDANLYEAVYIVLSGDYNHFAELHETILLEIRAALEKEGAFFAYPTKDVRVKSA